MAGSRWHDADIKKEMNEFIVKQFGSIKIIDTIMEHDIYLNHKTIDSLKLNIETIKQSITQYLLKKEMVLQVIDKLNIANAPLPQKIREMIFNGYNTTRSGDLQIIMKSGIMDATKMGISHSVWSPDDSHIPLLWYGWGIKHGSTHREILMTDIAATISALLNIQMPNGCIGHVITEIIQ